MKIWVKDRQGLYTMSVPDKIKLVYDEKKGLSVYANRKFKKSERITTLRGDLVRKEKISPFSIQFNDNYFIHDEDFLWEDFINHSCNPNARVDVPKRSFIAMRDIKKDEEITFNYLTTEHDMKAQGCDFKCHCGDINCFKQISGFKYLSKKQKQKLKPFISPYLLTKI
jgi:SET domain-containing protein